ncbi:MAG: hypothetical protein LBT20_04545, partial [Clostridiales bacterium]|nr:hypothetical protein [Clostridiales bacterium]
ILLEYAKNDREIKADLRLRLGNLKDVAESARKLIRVDLRKYTKSGFIDYHDMRHAVEGMYKVLNMVCGGAYDAVMRIRLCVVVLEEITGILGSCDDSNGEVCDIIYSATNRISKTIEENSERVEIFDIVFNHACAGFYDNWIDWRLDLLTTLVPLCGNADLRKKLTAYLSCGLECGDGDAENILYAIIKRFDGECAGETYVNSHLYNRSFRKTAIETAMSREQYELALSLCTDGEKADKNNGNLIIWKEYRYKIYEKQGMREGMRELGREFVLIGKYDIGFDYFKKLKPLYSAEEWDTVRDSLISAIENAPKGPYSYGFYSHRDMYIKILIHEKLKENLLIYCQKNPRDLEDLYRNLLPDYKNEISQIFEPYIFSQAEQASDRSSYQKVCITIQHSAKACGIEFAKPIIQTLYEKYRKKPAFLDELSQALK